MGRLWGIRELGKHRTVCQQTTISPEITVMCATSPSSREYLFQEIPREIQIWFRWTFGLCILAAICPDDFRPVSTTEFALKFLDLGLKLAATGTFLMGFKKFLNHKRLSNGLLVLAPFTILGLLIVYLLPPKSDGIAEGEQ